MSLLITLGLKALVCSCMVCYNFAEHVVGGGSQYFVFVMLGGGDLQLVYSIGYQLGMISGAL